MNGHQHHQPRSVTQVQGPPLALASAAALSGRPRVLPAALLATRRRALLAGTLAVLLLALAVLLALGAPLLLSDSGGEAGVLPPLTLPGQQAAPRLAFAIDGVARPLGVAASPDGQRIYVTESDGERQLKVFDRDGRLLRAVAPPDTGPAGRVPVYVAAHPDGRVYVSDRARGAVDVYSREGDYEGQLPLPAAVAGPWAPLALAVGPSGDLAVSDLGTGGHRVFVLAPDGTLRLTLGADEATPLSYPNGLALDAWGRIYVADSNNGRVLVFDGEGRLLWTLGRGSGWALAMPRGLAIAGGNRLYVADTTGHNVLQFLLGDAAPRYSSALAGGGRAGGAFSFPNGLATDETGRLYITDRETHRVQVWHD